MRREIEYLSQNLDNREDKCKYNCPAQMIISSQDSLEIESLVNDSFGCHPCCLCWCWPGGQIWLTPKLHILNSISLQHTQLLLSMNNMHLKCCQFDKNWSLGGLKALGLNWRTMLILFVEQKHKDCFGVISDSQMAISCPTLSFLSSKQYINVQADD